MQKHKHILLVKQKSENSTARLASQEGPPKKKPSKTWKGKNHFGSLKHEHTSK